ncbi:MAG: mannose-1-phosphate guanylyltransferase/mannose-6-phosphate isomerase [Candidatus Omnitrophota bacterium]
MNYAVILAGGAGSRFWPFSRELEPKQFMRITQKETLIESTIGRLKNIIPPENIYLMTNCIHAYELKEQIRKFRIPEENIILEPEGKNTAPAIGLSARLIEQRDKHAVIIVLPADHYIKNLGGFKNCLKKAAACAKDGFLVTVGIPPKGPSTGYGYIKVCPQANSRPSSNLTKLAGNTGYFKVKKFLEKPNLDKAKRYFKDKTFFWNSGIFVWKASVLLGELKSYLPELYSHLISINIKDDIDKIWPKIKPISIDYGVMEYSKKIVLIPADFDWTDLGSWDTLNNVLPKDTSGNILHADCLDLGSRKTCVFSRSNRLIATIGLEDLIIADTPDALLVCNRHKAQEVKKIVDQLKLSHRKEHLTHTTEKRPWGRYTVLQSGMGFKIKLIEIEPRKRLSLQRHKNRAEHWIVVSGCALITNSDKVTRVYSNQSIYIPKGTKHRLENPANLPLQIVEVQTGNYLEEDDIERFDDDFKR